MIPSRNPVGIRGMMLEDYGIGIGEGMASDAYTAVREGPAMGAVDSSRLAVAEAPEVNPVGQPMMPGYGGVASSGIGIARSLGIGWDGADRLSPEDANARYGKYGLRFAKPVRRQTAELLAEQKQREAERASINERWRKSDPGMLGWTGSAAATLAGSMMDPLNVLSAFVPVVGEARFAAMAARMGRTGATVTKGAIEGAAGAAMMEPLAVLGAQARGQEYGWDDSFANIAIGSVLGGGLHLAGDLVGRGAGAIGDIRAERRQRAMVDQTGRAIDEVLPEALPEQRAQLMAAAVAQMQAGQAVDITGLARSLDLDVWQRQRDAVAEFDRLFNEAEADAARPAMLRDGTPLSEAPATGWRAGEAGEDGRYSAYDPIRPGDLPWLQGEVAAVEKAAAGSRLFQQVDGQGSTAEISGQKSELPDWFQAVNRDAKSFAAMRRKYGRERTEGLRTGGITREEVRRVADKIQARAPLTAREADTAEILMGVVREKRAIDTAQRLEYRQASRDAFRQYLDEFAKREAAGDAAALAELDAVERLAVPEKAPAGRGLPEAEWGEFGPIYREPDLKSAIARLMREKDGEVPGALHHASVGPIDLMWGKEGTNQGNGEGLAKIIRWHPEVLDNLQGLLDGMHVKSRSPNRVRLESADHAAAVRLDRDGKAKTWLLTEYEKRDSIERRERAASERTTNISADDGVDGSPPPGHSEPATPGRRTDIAGDAADAGGMASSPTADGTDDNIAPIRRPRKKPADGPAAQEAAAAYAQADARHGALSDDADAAARAQDAAADAMARLADAEAEAAEAATACLIGALT